MAKGWIDISTNDIAIVLSIASIFSLLYFIGTNMAAH